MNILPFGICTASPDPAAVAATAAALGIATPALCRPAIFVPWTSSDGEASELGPDAILMCAWGGVIQIAASSGELTWKGERGASHVPVSSILGSPVG